MALFLALALFGMIGMVVFLLMRPSGEAERDRQRRTKGALGEALDEIGGQIVVPGSGSEFDVTDGQVRAALSGARVSLNMNPDDAAAFAVADEDDDEGEPDGGFVARLMNMFTDAFGGVAPPLALAGQSGGSGEVPEGSDGERDGVEDV
jgi:hypothetical protein